MAKKIEIIMRVRRDCIERVKVELLSGEVALYHAINHEFLYGWYIIDIPTGLFITRASTRTKAIESYNLKYEAYERIKESNRYAELKRILAKLILEGDKNV